MSRPAGDPQVRFWKKVRADGECWIWAAAVNKQTGYGAFSINKRMVSSHRFAYESMVGEIPAELMLDHLCRNRRCVNPFHLDPVTGKVNAQRGANADGGVGAAMQRAKTHCPQGHALSGLNLYRSPSKKRVCRTCRRASTERTRARRRSEMHVNKLIDTPHFDFTVTEIAP